MTAKRLPKIPPFPRKPGDVSKTLQAGVPVQLSHHQGERKYQEDRYVVASGLKVDPKRSRSFLSRMFTKAARMTDGNGEGSTGTALLLHKDLTLNAAFLGDSPIVLFIHDPKTGEATATQITRNHHANVPHETKMIERKGGFVAPNGRAGGRLMLSRAFGDAGILGISQSPEFVASNLKKHIDLGREVYVCLSSDGLFDTLSPQDYLQPFKDALKAGHEDRLAEVFASFAHHMGSQDNVTALVVKVPPVLDETLFMAIADGHGGDKTSEKAIRVFERYVADNKAAP